MSDCPYKDKCWRCSYSKLLRVNPYLDTAPPTRFQLVILGYANANMINKYKSLYATTFPLKSNYESQCPNMRGQPFQLCNEYLAEVKREERYKKHVENRKKFQNATPRTSIPKEIRNKIAKKFCYKCAYCNRVTGSYHDGVRLKAAVDHYIPLARGGSVGEDNLILACSICNRKKGTDIWQLGQEIGNVTI